MIKLYIADIIENCEILPCFSEYRKNKISKIKDVTHLYQSATAERLLCYAAKKENLSLPLNIVINENQKPFANDFSFNISHSHQKVVLAVSKNTVGVDIEKINHFQNLKVAKKFLTEKEAENIDINLFFEYFTKKESYFKMLGKAFPLKPVAFENFEKCFFETFKTDDYTVTVCSPFEFNLMIENVSQISLLNL